MDVEEKSTPVHNLQRVLPPLPIPQKCQRERHSEAVLLDESGAYDQVQRRQRMTTATLKGDQGSLAPANGCQMPGGKAAISTGQREVKP